MTPPLAASQLFVLNRDAATAETTPADPTALYIAGSTKALAVANALGVSALDVFLLITRAANNPSYTDGAISARFFGLVEWPSRTGPNAEISPFRADNGLNDPQLAATFADEGLWVPLTVAATGDHTITFNASSQPIATKYTDNSGADTRLLTIRYPYPIYVGGVTKVMGLISSATSPGTFDKALLCGAFATNQ